MSAVYMPANEPIDPVEALTERGTQPHSRAEDPERPVEVLPNSVRIHELTIARAAIAAYLEHIAPDKQEIALVHALDVGVTELAARRERFKK